MAKFRSNNINTQKICGETAYQSTTEAIDNLVEFHGVPDARTTNEHSQRISQNYCIDNNRK